MATEIVNIAPVIKTLTSTSRVLTSGTYTGKVGTLSAIGDVLSLRFNFAEQIDSIAAVNISDEGVTGTRTYAKAYYHSTDGTTWGASMSEAAFLALTPDKDDPAYFRVDFTRTGSDTTGTIDIEIVEISCTYDATGASGYGVLAEENTYGDLKELIEGMIDEFNPTYDEQKHFQFAWGPGEKCVPDGTRPNVFCHDLRLLDRYRNSDANQRTMTFRVGIRRKCIPQHKLFEEMRGIIKQRFGPNSGDFRYSPTIRGVKYIGIRLGYLGIFNLETFADAEITGGTASNEDLRCGCTWWETTVQMQVLTSFETKLIV